MVDWAFKYFICMSKENQERKKRKKKFSFSVEMGKGSIYMYAKASPSSALHLPTRTPGFPTLSDKGLAGIPTHYYYYYSPFAYYSVRVIFGLFIRHLFPSADHIEYDQKGLRNPNKMGTPPPPPLKRVPPI